MKTIIAGLLLSFSLVFAQTTSLDYNSNGITELLTAGGAISSGQLVKLNSQKQVIAVVTSDTSGVLGVALTAAQQSGTSIRIATFGIQSVVVDGVCSVGDPIIISSTIAGSGHCGVSGQSAGQEIGTAYSASSAAGNIQANLSLGPSEKNIQQGNLTFSGTNTHSGVETFTGNVTATAGQNTLNFYNHNNILWVGTTSPYKYTTLETGLTATECPAAGCNVNLVNNFGETFTSTITVGNNSTNRYAVEGYPNSGMTCNITNGTNCFTLQRNTALTGQILGGLSALAGLTLTYPATANISNFITTNDGVANFKGYVRLANFEVNGNASATVSNAVIDVAAVSNQSEFRNLFVSNFGSTIGFLVRSVNQTNGVAGPLNIENVWTDPSYNAGAKPCVLQAQSHTVFSINWIGGTCNHPGSGQTMFLIDGGGVAGQLKGVNIEGNYLENSQNGSSIGYKLVDANAVHISGSTMLIQDTDTAIDLSQTVTSGTTAVQVTSFYKSSPTNAATTINNHITGFTNSNAIVPFYSYGGDVSASVMPFTIESNNVQIYDGANHLVMSVPAQSTTGVQPTFANGANALGFFNWKCGLTATQNCFYIIKDRGTDEWGFGTDTSNNLAISDRVNIKTRIFFSQSAAAPTTGNLRLLTGDSVSWRNNANGADLLLAKNTSDILTYAGLPHTVTVASDFTQAANTSLQLITGLTWTMPANEALTLPFSCHLMYSQATAAVADQFGIQDVTVAPTNIAAKATVWTSASVANAANLPTLATTTATAINTFTPSAITTVWNADIDGVIEQPSNASTSAIQIQVQTSNSADLITVKRGSFCTLNW